MRRPLTFDVWGVLVGVMVLLSSAAAQSQESSDDDLLESPGAAAPAASSNEPAEAEAVDEPETAPAVQAAPKAEVTQNPAASDRIKAVPRKAVLKKGRFELAGFGSFSLNDAFWEHYALSGSAVFYPHDAFGFGLGADWLYAHASTSNVEVVRQAMTAVQPTFEKPRLFVHLDLYWVPIYGKVSLFDSYIVHFDLYASTGVGVVTAFGERKPVAVNAAFGQRFFLTDWLALRFEVRDHFFVDTVDVNQRTRSDIQNYVMFMAGASFFVPPSFEYSYR